MANFLLDKFDDALWLRVKHRALNDGVSLRALVLALLKLYASGEVKLPKDKK